jgi:hypothetical protein
MLGSGKPDAYYDGPLAIVSSADQRTGDRPIASARPLYEVTILPRFTEFQVQVMQHSAVPKGGGLSVSFPRAT